jgi:hypothetical protein
MSDFVSLSKNNRHKYNILHLEHFRNTNALRLGAGGKEVGIHDHI